LDPFDESLIREQWGELEPFRSHLKNIVHIVFPIKKKGRQSHLGVFSLLAGVLICLTGVHPETPVSASDRHSRECGNPVF
jgi:hypothetical protein